MLISASFEDSRVKVAQDESSVIAKSILPLLKTFTSDGVGIIGCHSARIARESCEYDLLVLGGETLPFRTVKVGDVYLDVLFREAGDLGKADPEFLAALATVVPLRDTSLVLGGSRTTAKRGFQGNCRRAVGSKLTSALKSLGRAREALDRDAVQDADFWLLSAGYDFSFASAYSKGIVAAPSHILDQMKHLPRSPSRFRDWSDAVGLTLASRTSCENRLEGLSIVYDFLRSVEPDPEMLGVLSRYRSVDSIDLLKVKTSFLLRSIQSVDCFTFLGVEVVRSILDLTEYRSHELKTEPEPSKTIEFLTSGKDRLIAQDVISLLGLVRPRGLVGQAIDKLRDSVSVMAKLA